MSGLRMLHDCFSKNLDEVEYNEVSLLSHSN